MKKLSLIALVLAAVSCSSWQPVTTHIMTPWGEELNPKAVWTEYPRPQLVRSEWVNLNGMWDYDIVPCDTTVARGGKILVPFCPESALSGVGERIAPGEKLHYSRTFKVPSSWKGSSVILNFGAVDCICEVSVNGVKVGGHEGGFAPFSIDITSALKSGSNTLELLVEDEVRDSFWGVGKQLRKPKTIWYTPVTGIWQTVWMEPVPQNGVKSLRITPCVDESTIYLTVNTASSAPVEVELYDGDALVCKVSGATNEALALKVAEPKLWTPDTPFLYDIKVRTGADEVASYAALRKISVTAPDENGFKRIALNDKKIFLMAPLDQGWWPDGLLTPPSEEAILFDIVETKALGFNSIRKHIKVEPDRWYYACDRLGIVVWQDMPSSQIDLSKGYWSGRYQWIDDDTIPRSEESMACYRKEWKEIIDALYNHPCICMWVPFNEGWGQSNTIEISNWTASYDPSRLVNAASGGNFVRGMGGQILDMHHYPQPKIKLIDKNYVNVLGEYGGIGMSVPGHKWQDDFDKSGKKKGSWGYTTTEDFEQNTNLYVEYAGMLLDMVPQGYSSGVYTQTTDVEIEINGLYTYDRKVLKMDKEAVRKANDALTHVFDK